MLRRNFNALLRVMAPPAISVLGVPLMPTQVHSVKPTKKVYSSSIDVVKIDKREVEAALAKINERDTSKAQAPTKKTMTTPMKKATATQKHAERGGDQHLRAQLAKLTEETQARQAVAAKTSAKKAMPTQVTVKPKRVTMKKMNVVRNAPAVTAVTAPAVTNVKKVQPATKKFKKVPTRWVPLAKRGSKTAKKKNPVDTERVLSGFDAFRSAAMQDSRIQAVEAEIRERVVELLWAKHKERAAEMAAAAATAGVPSTVADASTPEGASPVPAASTTPIENSPVHLAVTTDANKVDEVPAASSTAPSVSQSA